MDEDFKEFEAELIVKTEGKIKFYSYPNEKYADHGTALKKSMPVFYNPVMILNRDITMIAYKTIQRCFNDDKHKTEDSKFKICDCMAASGIRTLRLLKYLDNPCEIIANDLNPLALRLIQKNQELNEIENGAQYSNHEATFLFAKLRNEHQYQDIIDIDPFGTPNIFIEPALNAVNLRGFVAITATDTAVLFGSRPAACQRKYNAKPLRSPFMKEVGLRILIYFCAVRAHLHNNYIIPMMTFSADHYVRIFIQVFRGKGGVERNLKNSGYLQWCRKCLWRGSTTLNLEKMQNICPECGHTLEIGGPLWLGELHDETFLKECINTVKESTKEEIPSINKIEKILNLMVSENNYPPWFFHLHKIADHLTIPIVKTKSIIEEIENKGFRANKIHIDSRAIKSNIPTKLLIEILEELAKTLENN